jgi:hypothetical protein
VSEYRIPRDAARLIAIGLFREIGAYIQAADREDYAKFKAEYLAEQEAAQAPAPVKRRHARNRPVKSR